MLPYSPTIECYCYVAAVVVVMLLENQTTTTTTTYTKFTFANDLASSTMILPYCCLCIRVVV